MKPVELTAITNFILAAEVYFLAGRYFEVQKQIDSPAWWWNIVIFMLGTTALIGGVDHGFFEISGHPSRNLITKLNWSILGLLTFAIVMTVARQYSDGNMQKIIMVVGLVQLMVYLTFVFRSYPFLIVIINNLPIMLVLLIINIIGLLNGKGSVEIVIGVIVLIVVCS